MELCDPERRSLLLAVGGLGMSQLLPKGMAQEPSVSSGGSVVRPGDAEHLIHFRDHGDIFISIGASTPSPNLAMGTQQVIVGTGIPTHRHFKMDEAFSVLKGSGVVILNDVRHPFEEGDSVFIPKNTWHGFENPHHELLLLWVVTPAGLDGFFRDTCNPPAVPPKQLTREQIREIAAKYDTEFR